MSENHLGNKSLIPVLEICSTTSFLWYVSHIGNWGSKMHDDARNSWSWKGGTQFGLKLNECEFQLMIPINLFEERDKSVRL